MKMKVGTAVEPLWPKRLAQIESPVEEIRLPDADEDVSQDAEWCEAKIDGEVKRIRFHDYHEVYSVPGLYESLFYERLKCCSPSRVAALLQEIILDFGDDPQDLRVLDLGAGNGMVGDELQARGAECQVGVDIIDEAKEAALRDRPEVYDDYFVTDMTDLPERHEEQIRKRRLNCLVSVAALGFGDIPPKAFLKSLDLIEVGGWVAFTIKEEFLHQRDSSGFQRAVRALSRHEILQTYCQRRFRHRNSITGQPLHYVIVIARKQDDVPGEWLEDEHFTVTEN
jgi:predicted TPR repeat methyltransferase